MIPIFYSPAYVGSAYAFDTTRKARWVADSLLQEPIPGLRLMKPAALIWDQVVAVHDPDYVRSIERGEPRALAESQGFEWDAGLWPMVLASNGGVVAAARAALEGGTAGSLSSGLHHARRRHGAGFCTFNGLVIAARAALEAGARTVLILDLDAHCGGGTASLIADEPRLSQVDVSVSGLDSYPSSDRARLDVVSDPAHYLRTIRARLAQLAEQAPFDLCLYNAGMDPFERCPIGGMGGIDQAMLAERERLVFEWCRVRRLPIAFVLAGGYVGPGLDERGIITLHRLTLSQAAAASGPTV